MTKHQSKNVKGRRKDAPTSDGLSNAELAQFLKRLASIYKDQRYGNPQLAAGLDRLATNLMLSEDNSGKRQPSTSQLPLNFKESTDQNLEHLKNLDGAAVERILLDGTKTKSDLIELANARFSIARGKLLKSSIDVIRQTIRSALSHERSIKIIFQEAHKRGAQRSS